MNLRIFCQRQPWDAGAIAVYIGAAPENGDRGAIALPIQFRKLMPEDEAVERPAALTLSPDEGQRLMDELWNTGLRPTEGSGSAGALAATQRHLEDMRTLVFKKE